MNHILFIGWASYLTYLVTRAEPVSAEVWTAMALIGLFGAAWDMERAKK